MAIGGNMFSDLVPASGPHPAGHEDLSIQPGSVDYRYVHAVNPLARTTGLTGQTVGQPGAPAPGAAPLPVPMPAPVAAPAPAALPAPAPALATPPAPAPTAPAPTQAPAPGITPQSALDGWNTFYNSPAYQVPLAEGLKGVNTKYAAMGALESGAAMKAINDYAAGHAASALGTYMDDLYRQEALGMSASSALAGVGQNLVSQVSANNNAAGSAAGNAALIGGQASANNWNNVGTAIGTAAGGIAGAMGSSYGVPSLQATNPNASNYIAPFGTYGF